MTLALRSVGTIVAGATSAAPAFNAGAAADDAVHLVSTWKDETATAPVISGWTKVIDEVFGSGADGASVGQQRFVMWRQDSPVANQSGTVTVTPSGSVNIVIAGIIGHSKTLAAWDIIYDFANDTTAAANMSANSQAQIAQAAGDLMVFAACHCANSNMGSTTINTAGVTYGASATEHAEIGSNTGNRARLGWYSRPVTSGPQTDVTVFSATITPTVTGGAGIIRLRETAGGGGGGRTVGWYNGTDFVQKPLMRWDGAAWVADETMQRWDGAAWGATP